MKQGGSGLADIMCAAVEIKEKMKKLYADAAEKCSDQMGSETFRMLRDMEQSDLERLGKLSAELSMGADKADVCRFYDFEPLQKTEIMKKIRQQGAKVSKACLDDIAAVESGIDLERKCIDFFEKQAQQATGAERDLLTHMQAQERAHYILLADLKFYYTDPEGWTLEKSRADLDGA